MVSLTAFSQFLFVFFTGTAYATLLSETAEERNAAYKKILFMFIIVLSIHFANLIMDIIVILNEFSWNTKLILTLVRMSLSVLITLPILAYSTFLLVWFTRRKAESMNLQGINPYIAKYIIRTILAGLVMCINIMG